MSQEASPATEAEEGVAEAAADRTSPPLPESPPPPEKRRRALRRLRRLALGSLGVALLGAVGWAALEAALGVRRIDADAEPYTLAPGPMGHFDFDAVLREVVREEGVDYAALQREEGRLRRYAATLGGTGPNASPARVPRRADVLAWYINAYNALTLLGVMEHWPIDSVQDVHGAVEPVQGMGFFWALRFYADGRWLSLHALEGELREMGDARIHAAINCASRSCPSLSTSAYEAETVDVSLDAASVRFVEDHVRVDEERDAIVMSSIFTWYDADFASQAEAEDWGLGMIDWVRHFAGPDLEAEITRARAAGYALVFEDYDWSLNRAATGADARLGGEVASE